MKGKHLQCILSLKLYKLQKWQAERSNMSRIGLVTAGSNMSSSKSSFILNCSQIIFQVGRYVEPKKKIAIGINCSSNTYRYVFKNLYIDKKSCDKDFLFLKLAILPAWPNPVRLRDDFSEKQGLLNYQCR